MWPENAPVWDVWLAMEGQWRVVAGLSGWRYVGLEYASINIAIEMAGAEAHRAVVLRGLRIMQRAALEAFSEQQ